MVCLLAPVGIWKSCRAPYNNRRGEDLHWDSNWRKSASNQCNWGLCSCNLLLAQYQTHSWRWFTSVPGRNSKPHGVTSSPPCLCMPSSWPTFAAAGPSTCSSSVSRRILRKSSASPSARLGWQSDKRWSRTSGPMSIAPLPTGGDPVCCAPHGDDHCSAHRRTTGWPFTQQENYVNHKCEETDELRRYVMVNWSHQCFQKHSVIRSWVILMEQ